MDPARTAPDRSHAHAGSDSDRETAWLEFKTASPAVGAVAFHDRPARSAGAAAIGAVALGACAIGATALGALAIGRMAIGVLRLKRGRVKTLAVDELTVGRLHVRELVIDNSIGR